MTAKKPARVTEKLTELGATVSLVMGGDDILCIPKKALGAKGRERHGEIHLRLDKNGCWMITKEADKKNYGVVTIDRKSTRASRFFYALFKGEPGKLLVCHTCDRPGCVNPEHLFLGTHRDNSLDASSKGRLSGPRSGVTWNSKKTHCKSGHPFSGDNVRSRVDSDGFNRRRCLACHRIRKAKYLAAMAAERRKK